MKVQGLMVLALLALAACPASSDTSGGSDDTSAASATETATETASAPTGGAVGGLGAPCDHAGDPDLLSGMQLTPSDPACGDALCVFPDVISGPAIECTDDAACNASDPDGARFTCVAGACNLTRSYKLSRSMCAASCADDDDCAVADPATACEGGFRCAIVTPSCCTPMCLCQDDLAEAAVDLATEECAQQAEPSCAL